MARFSHGQDFKKVVRADVAHPLQRIICCPGKVRSMQPSDLPITTVRITLRDQEQTISFLGKRDTVHRLVAGCSVGPASIGDLLVATDTYEHGLTSRVMAELMRFDNEQRRQGPGPLHKAIRRARKRKEPLASAFQVIDDLSETEALRPRGCPVIVFDLVKKAIHASPELELTTAGEVHVHNGERETEQTVAYFLPEKWSIHKQ